MKVKEMTILEFKSGKNDSPEKISQKDYVKIAHEFDEVVINLQGSMDDELEEKVIMFSVLEKEK